MSTRYYWYNLLPKHMTVLILNWFENSWLFTNADSNSRYSPIFHYLYYRTYFFFTWKMDQIFSTCHISVIQNFLFSESQCTSGRQCNDTLACQDGMDHRSENSSTLQHGLLMMESDSFWNIGNPIHADIAECQERLHIIHLLWKLEILKRAGH